MHNTSYFNCFYRNKQERTTGKKWLGVYCVYFKGKWMCIKKEGSLFMVDPRDHSSYMFWHKIYTICKKVKYIFFPLIYLVKITGRPRWFVSNEHTGWLLCAMKCIRYWIKVDKYVNRENLLLLCSYLKQICRDISALVILIETNWAHHFWFLWYRTWMNFSVVRQVLNIFLIEIFLTQSHTWSFTLKKL